MNMEIETNNITHNRILIEGVDDVSPFSGFGQWWSENSEGLPEVLTSVGVDTSSVTFPRSSLPGLYSTTCSHSVCAS